MIDELVLFQANKYDIKQSKTGQMPIIMGELSLWKLMNAGGTRLFMYRL